MTLFGEATKQGHKGFCAPSRAENSVWAERCFADESELLKELFKVAGLGSGLLGLAFRGCELGPSELLPAENRAQDSGGRMGVDQYTIWGPDM